MNKLEYLGQLEAILKKQHLSKAEIDDIIRDYAEFFEEGRRQGQSDAEISAKLGSPELIAEQLTEENPSAGGNSTNKTEFKMPEVKLPKFKFKEKKENEETTPPPMPKEKSHHLGCLAAMIMGLLKACFLCVAVPTLAFCFAAAACSLIAVICGLLFAFVCVIGVFGAGAIAAHFLTWQTTLFLIFACITLVSLLICLGALVSECLLWCCKLFGKLLGDLFRSKEASANPVPVPSPYIMVPVQETVIETITESEEVQENE